MTLNAHTGSLDPQAPNEPWYAAVVHHANVKASVSYVRRKTGLSYEETARLLELALQRGDLAEGSYAGRRLPDPTDALLARIAELEAWQEEVRSNSPLLARLERAEQRVQELEAERDEAERRATAAPVPELWRGLMTEARDNCRASIAEDGISDIRRQYREGLLSRIDDALAAAPKPTEPAPFGLPRPDVQLCAVGLQLQPVMNISVSVAVGRPLALYTADTVRTLLKLQMLASALGVELPDLEKGSYSAAREHLRGLMMKQAWDRGLKSPDCNCESCDIAANGGLRSRMSLCPQCGDKRCPRAQHHNNQCAKTGATN